MLYFVYEKFFHQYYKISWHENTTNIILSLKKKLDNNKVQRYNHNDLINQLISSKYTYLLIRIILNLVYPIFVSNIYHII